MAPSFRIYYVASAVQQQPAADELYPLPNKELARGSGVVIKRKRQEEYEKRHKDKIGEGWKVLSAAIDKPKGSRHEVLKTAAEY
jgi:hypothetical protein